MASYTNFMPGETLTAEKLNSAFSFLESKIDTLHLDAAPIEYVDRVVANASTSTLSNANGYTDTAIAAVNTTVSGLAQSVDTINNALSSKANAADVYTKAQTNGLYDVLPQLAQGTLVAQIKTPAGTKPLYVPAFNPDWVTDEEVDAAIDEHLTSYVTSEDLDEALETKADTTSVYTKTQVDTALADKVDSDDVYAKSEVYTKDEADALVSVEQRLTQGTVIAHVTTPEGSVDLYAPTGGGGGGGVSIEEVDAEIEDYLEDYSTTAEINTALAEKADASTTYTKTQVDNAIAAKADAATTYTKTEVDAGLSEKADADSVYTSDQVDTLLEDKADADSVYTTTQVDTALAAKANVDNVYPKASLYTRAEVEALIAASALAPITLHAIYPFVFAGRVITATNGAEVVSATVDANGVVDFPCYTLGDWVIHDTTDGYTLADSTFNVPNYGYYTVPLNGIGVIRIPCNSDRGVVTCELGITAYLGEETQSTYTKSFTIEPGTTCEFATLVRAGKSPTQDIYATTSLNLSEAGGISRSYSFSASELVRGVGTLHLFDDPTILKIGGTDVGTTTCTITIVTALDNQTHSVQVPITNGVGTYDLSVLGLGCMYVVDENGEHNEYAYSLVGYKNFTVICNGNTVYPDRVYLEGTGTRLINLTSRYYMAEEIFGSGSPFALVNSAHTITAAIDTLLVSNRDLMASPYKFTPTSAYTDSALHLRLDLTCVRKIIIACFRASTSKAVYAVCRTNRLTNRGVRTLQAPTNILQPDLGSKAACEVVSIDVEDLSGEYEFVIGAGNNSALDVNWLDYIKIS